MHYRAIVGTGKRLEYGLKKVDPNKIIGHKKSSRLGAF